MMSLINALPGAVAQGLIWGIMAPPKPSHKQLLS